MRCYHLMGEIKEVKSKYDDYNVSVTGHSAGGSLANYLGVEHPDYAVNTFNMGQGLPFISNTIKCKLGNCENINNFRIVGDWASSLSDTFSPGKVFNMKPIIPTDEMNLQADSQETFYYPNYMSLPHNINQFIDREQNEPLPDYGQYGRKLAGNIGGITAAIGLPYGVKKINSAVGRYTQKMFNAQPNPNLSMMREDSTELRYSPGIQLMSDPDEQFDRFGSGGILQEMVADYSVGSMLEQQTDKFLKKNTPLRLAKNFFGGMANMNDVVGGLAGFGVGDVAGTALYESVLKPGATPLKSKKTFKTQTEITDLDSEKYFSNTFTAIALGTGITGMSLGGIGYFMQNHL